MSDPWNSIPGDSGNYPLVIRAIGGGENRTSAIFDREISDLADRTANLNARTYGQRVVRGYQLGVGHFINFGKATAGTAAVTDNASSPVSMTIANCGLTDLLDISIGPLTLTITHSTGDYAIGQLIVKVENDTNVTDYECVLDTSPLGSTGSGAFARQLITLNIPHVVTTVAAAGAHKVSLVLGLILDSGGAGAVQLDSPGNNHLGTAALTWPVVSGREATQIWGRVLRLGIGS